jgi:hypothetical protein
LRTSSCTSFESISSTKRAALSKSAKSTAISVAETPTVSSHRAISRVRATVAAARSDDAGLVIIHLTVV